MRHRTDLARLDAMTDDDIARQVADNPDAAPLLTDEELSRMHSVEPSSNESRPARRTLIDLLVLYCALAAAGWLYAPNSTALQTWIVFLTGLGLIWYSWETRLGRIAARRQIEIAQQQIEVAGEQREIMIEQVHAAEAQRAVMVQQANLAEQQRRVMVRQLKMQIRPYLVIETSYNPFAIKNLGLGTALNVQVRDVRLPEETLGISLRFKPAQIPYILPGATANLEVHGQQGDKALSDFLAAHLNTEYATFALDVTIDYQNVEGKQYSTTHQVSPKSIKLGHIRD